MRLVRSVLTLLFLVGTLLAPATARGAEHRPPLPEVTLRAADLPPAERWMQHLKEELLPFWDRAEALGTPVGNFPTYRCNDGSLPDRTNLCPELNNATFVLPFL